MVQTNHAYKIEFEDEKIPQRIKKVYKKTNSSKKTLLKIGMVAFIYCVIIVYLCIKVSTMGYQVVKLKNDIEDLYAANRMLEFQIAKQVSLDRVEKIAITELGMRKSDASKAIAVAVNQPKPQNNRSSEQAATNEDNSTNIREGALQKLFDNLVLLAERR